MDYCERQIAAYARQNFEWANIWKLDCAPGRPAFVGVEEHMSRFAPRAVDRRARGVAEGPRRIPFRDQARLFSPVYWNSKLSYRLRKSS